MKNDLLTYLQNKEKYECINMNDENQNIIIVK